MDIIPYDTIDTNERFAQNPPLEIRPEAADAALKLAELDLALASLAIEEDGFEPSVRKAFAECGFAFLFNLPVPEPGDVQRVAAGAFPASGSDVEPTFAFITLHGSGTSVTVSDQCDALPQAPAVARAWLDLMLA